MFVFVKVSPGAQSNRKSGQIIKRYVRNKNDEGNLPKVRALYKEAIKEEQLLIKLIRKFIRLMYLYLFAYEQGLGVIETETFRKERKPHRSHNSSTDAVLEARVQVLYSPETGIELEETIMNNGFIEEEMNEEDLEDIEENGENELDSYDDVNGGGRSDRTMNR